MRKLGCLLGLILVVSLTAAAQTAPKAEIFTGFSYVRSDGANFRGWNASVAGNPNDWFGIVGDFSGLYYPPAGVNFLTYTVGPQFSSRRNEKVVPFVHALIGGARAGGGGFSSNGFATNLGGGIDWVASPGIGIRVLQVDALVTRFSGVTSTDARLSFGIVFRINR